jgi:hypothetical protein
MYLLTFINILFYLKISIGYSVVTITFITEREKYLGYAEAAVGIG